MYRKLHSRRRCPGNRKHALNTRAQYMQTPTNTPGHSRQPNHALATQTTYIQLAGSAPVPARYYPTIKLHTAHTTQQRVEANSGRKKKNQPLHPCLSPPLHL
mmetsp:Transcript_23247/g.64229  ORF Transcript_23247/g.64229 Transcript_23247/m.64229 type:complete len:102 (-) Transcript_23247:2135-2440(-)